MTTVAVKSGTIAADSWIMHPDGARYTGIKLHRKTITEGRRTFEVIIGIAGNVSAAMVFVDWYGTAKEPPKSLIDLDGDFSALILSPKGIFEADIYCRLVPVLDPFYAIGSGAIAALGAMHCGKSARQAVEIAARIDPNTGGRILSMSLPPPPQRKKKRG